MRSVFKRKPYLAYLILLIIVFLFMESTLVVKNAISNNKSHIVFTLKDVKFHHDYIKNVTFVTHPTGADSFNPVTVTVNSYGMRGPLLSKKNKKRVLMLGDSFIQADEVLYEETFGFLLEKKIKNIEFISHGISSWSPTTEFSWLFHKGIPLELNEVNLFLCVNDFFLKKNYKNTDETYRNIAIYNEANIPIGYKFKNHASSKTLINNTLKKSKLIKLLYKSIYISMHRLRYKNNKATTKLVEGLEMIEKDSQYWPKELKINVFKTMDVVQDINLFLLKKGIKLRVFLITLPFAWNTESVDGKNRWYSSLSNTTNHHFLSKELTMHFKKHSIEYHDLFEVFDKQKNSKPSILLFNEYDGHWNKEGHRVLANYMEKFYNSPHKLSSQISGNAEL